MFSGIVEGTSQILKSNSGSNSVQLTLKKPSDFKDLSVGDSVAVDGVCLTIEAFDENEMSFTLAAETLQITQWRAQDLAGRQVNVERSLKWGDRVHGHLVSGHVDGRAKVLKVDKSGDSSVLSFSFPAEFKPYVWRKGSIAINGVSLTINHVESNTFEVCLIPETWKRTNLSSLKVDDEINFEVDPLARGIVESVRNFQGEKNRG